MIQTTTRNFWIAQVLGWGIFASMNFLVQFTALKSTGDLEGNLVGAIVNATIAFVGGVFLTTVYRYYLKKRSLNLLNFKVTLGYIIVGTVVLSVCFIGIISLLLLVFHEGRVISSLEIVGNMFYFGILLLIWNSLYFIIHYIHSWKNAESEKWRLAASAREAQLGNLKAQINPHFMFNAINNIKALISEDPERAKKMLLNFSDMFRYSLINNDHSMVELEEEVNIVKKYLELVTIQFEEKLRFEIEVEEELLDEKVPPMMLQLLVENAVKHGISELTEGGVVKVNVYSEQDQIHLVVRNTGDLNGSISLQQKLGVGLNNIRKRLKLLYGDSGGLALKSIDGIVEAMIHLPRTEKI